MSTVDNIHRVVALAGSEADARPAGARAGAKLAPGTPGSILLHLVGILPHAVTFVAPLRWEGVRQNQIGHNRTKTVQQNADK